MKIQMRELENSKAALARLAARDLDPVAAFSIGDLIVEVDLKLKTFTSEDQKLIKKFGALRDVTDEEREALGPNARQVIAVLPENRQQYLEERAKFLDVEVELKYEPFVTRSMLGTEKMKGGDYAMWKPFLKEE